MLKSEKSDIIDAGQDAELWWTDDEKPPLRVIRGATSLRSTNQIAVKLNCGHTVVWDRPPVKRVAIDVSRMVHCPFCKED